MKKILLLTCLLVNVVFVKAVVSNAAPWFRSCAISPDATTIVFTYKGDIYTVPSVGGKAVRLTSNPAWDGYPCWSPDGKNIAFSSDRFGGLDIMIISKEGGAPKRLTTNSALETVITFLDNEHILYKAWYMPTKEEIIFPSGFSQVYSVDLKGHRPTLFSALQMEGISINKYGQMLYYDKKGFEDDWRKHHNSPITRDLFLSQVKEQGRTYKKLTTDNVENRNAVWTPDGKGYYFLSEKDGIMNVYKVNAIGEKPIQITNYKKHPVRYLSIATNGMICYSWDGNLYTMKNGENAKKVNIEILTDETEEYNMPRIVTGGVENAVVSKDEKEIVFTVEGDLYTTVMDYSTTKRLTKTPEKEAYPTISPDGRTIVFASERGNTWNIYKVSLVNKADKNFTYATDVKEEPLITGNEPYTHPKYSPDGNKIAFLANRTEIRVYDVKTKNITMVLPAKDYFSYTDDAMDFEWSPDSKWLLTTTMANGGWNNEDVAVVSADGKKIVNLTQSGYTDNSPHWALGGKAVIWQSDRAGYRSHGSWGSEFDVYIMYLDREAWLLANLDKEDKSLYTERMKQDSTEVKNDKKEKSDKNKDDKKEGAKVDSVKLLKLDFEGREERIKKLTLSSSHIGNSFLTPDGTKLYYTSVSENGYDLWLRDLENYSTKIIVKGFGFGDFVPDAKGENIYVLSGSLRKVTLSSGNSKNIGFRAECDGDDADEREYIFNHCVNQIEQRFCDVDYHGIDFKEYAEHYRHFLPNIGNKHDLSEMFSELLGELNCSHTGLRYYYSSNFPRTASLGAFFNADYEGDGLLIDEVLEGGPLDIPNGKIKAGYVITELDHNKIEKNMDYFPLLTNKAGKWMLLTYKDDKGKVHETHIKPISSGTLSDLLYNRWVKRCEKFTDEYSKGKIAYVHVKAMNSLSFRDTYSKVLGKYRDRNALVVDDRNNGGGWLHEDLGILLSGKKYQTFSARGQYIGQDPYNRWTKPSCVLMCENCYSNAHGFPAMYKALNLGKLVGSPMAGTMSAVWWENIDSHLTLGVPEILCIDNNGKPLENQQLNPDIMVENTPEQILKGEDAQLKRAIDLMLEEVK